MLSSPQPTKRKIYKVSQLNSAVRLALENNFSLLWIEGEISNLTIPASGHIYFSLKDATAQIRCVMFKNRNHSSAPLQLTHGLHVIVQAQISLYEPRGDYQAIVSNIEKAGDGALHEKFMQLKVKLAALGLFEAKHKKPIPFFPKCIGVITSPTGAAIRDILCILKRRFPVTPIIIYPSQVQGNEAAKQIVAAINIANTRHECDVLILARGGGSLEDLWPFNEEIVAHAIYNSSLPIISAIGHEIDFTIADFVADLRAPTPSAAAERVVPDKLELLAKITHLNKCITNLINYKIQQANLLLKNTTNRLHHPRYYLQQHAQTLDNLEHRLKLSLLQIFKQYKQHLASLTNALGLVNPLAILARGFTVISKHNKLVCNIDKLEVGDLINVGFATGNATCKIEKITHQENKQ
jgi:exodeoxyribonuclease VII large subunit